MPTISVEVLFWLKGRLGFPDEGRATLDVSIAPGDTVGDVLALLASERPAFAEHVFDASRGVPYEHVVVLLNRRAVELQGGMAAALADGDELLLMPGFAGGQSL